MYDNYRKLTQKDVIVRSAALGCLLQRGISQSIAEQYHITTLEMDSSVLVFPFYDENGEMVTVEYCNVDCVQDVDETKEWFETDTKPILFGMHQCSASEKLIITDSKFNCLTLAECDIANAVSIPGKKRGMEWVKHCYEWVDTFKQIIIFGEYTDGYMPLAEEIAKCFPEKVIRVVKHSDYLGEKDANAILLKHGKDAVRQCIDNAELLNIRAVKKLSDVEDVDLAAMEHIYTGIYDLDKAIGGMYLGQLIIITGKRGEGKSTLSSQILVNALRQGYSVFVYSGELPDFHVKSWLHLQIAGAENVQIRENDFGEEEYFISDEVNQKINRWHRERAFIFDNNAVTDELSVSGAKDKNGEPITLLGTIQKAVCRYGIRLVLVDNLMTALDVEPSLDLYRAQSEFVKKLKALAVKLDIVIILVAHPKKENGKELDSDSVSGSSDITNIADTVLTYSRNDGKDNNIYQSLIGVSKNRLLGTVLTGDERIKVKYSVMTRRIICDSDEQENHDIYDFLPLDLPEKEPGELPF